MMLAEDIRQVNRLERNAKRLEKARKLIELVHETNEVADCDLLFIADKLQKAEKTMIEIRKAILK